MQKIKLYHYSDIKIKKYVKVNHFGKNAYTDNDVNASDIKRAFYYIDSNIEQRFKNCQFIYIVNVKRALLYDLRQDEKGLINKYRYKGLEAVNITELLKIIKKQGFKGVIYNIGKINIVNLFINIRYNKIISKQRN